MPPFDHKGMAASLDTHAALGVAVREFPMSAGLRDDLLFVEGKAAGVIEAMSAGVTLSGAAGQAARHMAGLPKGLASRDQVLGGCRSQRPGQLSHGG